MPAATIAFGVVCQMGVSTALRAALGTVFTPLGLVLLVGATLLGVLMGALPGLGGPVALSLLIPSTFDSEPASAFMIMAAALGGVNFGGSVTAILFNTPGTAPNAATLFDGHPLAEQGRANEAIAASAVASAAGAVLGFVLFSVLLPVLTPLALAFWSPEYFWLAVIGLATIAVASTGSVLADLTAGALGVAFTFHGLNPITGGVRFTGSIRYLESGIPLVPAIIGLFAIAEMARLFAREGTVITAANAAGDRIAGLQATASHWRTALSCGLIGWAVGVIPGVGGTVANFVAYLNAKETAAEPSSFGQGNIAGVVASEAANDAKDGGSLVPTLALGIPGSASTAVLLGAFLLHGLTPGPLLIAERLDVVLVIVITLVLSNLIASSIGLLGSNVLARLTRVSTDVLVPLVLVTAVFGAFVIRGRLADVVLAAGFGLLGYGMARLDVSRVALVLGLVLGGLAESNFHRSLQISSGDYAIFYTRPLSVLLIIALLIVLSLPLYRARRERSKADRPSSKQ